jgi:AraC-like DNA-binding protein
MTTWYPAPPELRAWSDGGVVVRTPATLDASCFPAMVGSMLVLRLAGQVHAPDQRPLPTAMLVGPSTRPSRYLHAGAVHAVGLLIRPAALPALLGAPAAGLVDAQVALADAAGAAWARTEDAVHAARDDQQRLALLFAHLRQAVAGPQHARRHGQLQRLAQAIQGPLDAACCDLALSRRQLERQCHAHFGMAPKQFQAIARLQRALHGAARSRGADLALQAGFYDQSHLARDLRRLAGQPLGRLVQQARQAVDASHAGNASNAHWPLAVGWQLSA